jgi:hypothetical protein
MERKKILKTKTTNYLKKKKLNKFSTLYTEEEIQIKAEYIIETREKEHDDIRSCLNATTTNSV